MRARYVGIVGLFVARVVFRIVGTVLRLPFRVLGALVRALFCRGLTASERLEADVRDIYPPDPDDRPTAQEQERRYLDLGL